MTLQERFDKLEPRERRLLTLLGGFVAVVLFLLIPIGIFSLVSGRRSDNDDVRELIQSIQAARGEMSERKARHDALLMRYAKPAPQLAGFLEEKAKEVGLPSPESQDRPDVPHGKRYNERITVVKLHKVSMLPVAKMLEKVEQSGHAVSVTRLNIKPRSNEPDSYEIELGVSAYDRKADAPSAAGSAAASASGRDARPAGETSGAPEER
jgi:general secretion pathway protein M